MNLKLETMIQEPPGQAKDRRLVYAGLTMLLCAANVGLAGGSLDFTINADFYGKYIWRGQNLVDDLVLQTAISASYEGLTAAVWGNLDLTNVNRNSGDFSELDYSLDYSSSMAGLEGLGYSLGLIHYDFPGTDIKDTTEFYWGLSLDLPASPSLRFYHDLDEADGTYIVLAGQHCVDRIAELGPEMPVGMEIGAGIGWGSGSYDKYYWGIEPSKLNDLTLSASFPLEVGAWTVTPSLNYVTLLNDKIRDSDVYGTDSDFFFVGVSCSKRF